jgi:hypothetical protein
MIVGMSFFSFGIFIIGVVGIAFCIIRLVSRPGESREDKAIARALASQPWDVDKSNRSGNR